MTQSERKSLQRRRDRAAGWAEVTVKCAAVLVDDVRAYAASLPPPSPSEDPNQLSLLAALDR